jgi:hypothetical protein
LKLTAGSRTAVAIVVALFALVFVGAAPAAATSGSAVVVPNATYADCTAGNACFYTGANGTGSMCKWSNADKDWTTAPDVCSWALTSPARSIYNHGTSTSYTAVAFYIGRNYQSYNGCMGQGWQGNIGPVFLLSHQWVHTAC